MTYQAQIIQVILIEEQKVIREGLRILLESESDIKIVGSFNNSDHAFAQIEELKPTIVLISLPLSEANGINIVKTIQQKSPQTKIIVFYNEISAADLVEYLELGVKACLLKDIAAGKIKELVRYVARGYNHIEDKIFQKVLPELSDAVTALKIADSTFQDFLDSPSSEVLLNNNYQSSSLDYSYNFYPQNNTHFYLPLVNDVTLEQEISSIASEKDPHNNWRQGLISKLALACLGMGAIAIGIISSLQEAEIVIKDAVINGKTIAVTSPIEGTIQEINYLEGTNLEANQVFAALKPLEDKNLNQEILQLEMDISLKQEKINHGEKYLASLKNTLEILPRKSEIPINLPQSPEVATIFLDNAREIANLEQQILNQQLNISLLNKELSHLEDKLKQKKTESLNQPIIPLKAPISGAIQAINYSEGELISVGEEIATFIDCQDLWLEAIVDSKVATQINLQKNVSVQLRNQEYVIAGNINLIESLNELNKTNKSQLLSLTERGAGETSAPSIEVLTSTKTNNNINDSKSFSRLIIDLDFSSSELLLQDYCNVGTLATVSINN